MSLSMNEMRVLVNLQDKLPQAIIEAVEAIDASISTIVEGKNAADAAKTAKEAGVWGNVRAVVMELGALTAESKSIREMAFNAVFSRYVEAAKDSPEATVKAYMSTGRNMLCKLYDTVDHDTLADAKYKEVREMLAPPDDAEWFKRLDDMRSKLGTIRSKGFKAVRASAAKAELRSELAKLEADILKLYNGVEGESKSNRVADQASRALSDLTGKDNAPTATAVEVKAA